MAERLTDKNSIENKRYVIYNECNQINLTNAKLKNGFRKTYYYGKPINKLAELEDIMEKYGIESVEELDKLIDGMKSTISVLLDRNKNTKQDRDIWKKACELAREDISIVKIITNENMAESDDLPNYFYQQAKKELTNNYKVLGVDTNECKEKK